MIMMNDSRGHISPGVFGMFGVVCVDLASDGAHMCGLAVTLIEID